MWGGRADRYFAALHTPAAKADESITSSHVASIPGTIQLANTLESYCGYAMKRLCWLVAAVVVLGATQVRGEDQIAIYGGTAQTHSSDVRFRASIAGTDITYRGVDWRTEAFSDPYYYGLRYTHYFDEWPQLGISIDFTHNKIYANVDGVYDASGFRNGVPVTAAERMSTTFEDVAMSHGLNTLTVGPVYRMFLCEDDCGLSRVQPYVGVGIGVARPHAEVALTGLLRDEGYRWGGAVYQAQVGVNVRLLEHLSIFGEFKVTCVPNIDVDIAGGVLKTRAISHHFLVGPAFTW